MQRTKYAPEIKDEAVKQVIDKGHSVVDVAKRPGIPDIYCSSRMVKRPTGSDGEPSSPDCGVSAGVGRVTFLKNSESRQDLRLLSELHSLFCSLYLWHVATLIGQREQQTL